MQAFDRIRGSDRLPLAFREARESEQLVAGFFQADGDRRTFQLPFADEDLSLRLDLLLCVCVDHILVVGGDFLMQPVGGMSKEVAMFMHGATLNWNVAPERGERLLETRGAVDNDEFWRLQSAFDEIVE